MSLDNKPNQVSGVSVIHRPTVTQQISPTYCVCDARSRRSQCFLNDHIGNYSIPTRTCPPQIQTSDGSHGLCENEAAPPPYPTTKGNHSREEFSQPIAKPLLTCCRPCPDFSIRPNNNTIPEQFPWIRHPGGLLFFDHPLPSAFLPLSLYVMLHLLYSQLHLPDQ